jgi:chemotaxis response regulator CheB
MPKAAADNGAAERVVPLHGVAPLIRSWVGAKEAP